MRKVKTSPPDVQTPAGSQPRLGRAEPQLPTRISWSKACPGQNVTTTTSESLNQPSKRVFATKDGQFPFPPTVFGGFCARAHRGAAPAFPVSQQSQGCTTEGRISLWTFGIPSKMEKKIKVLPGIFSLRGSTPGSSGSTNLQPVLPEIWGNVSYHSLDFQCKHTACLLLPLLFHYLLIWFIYLLFCYLLPPNTSTALLKSFTNVE